MISKTKQSKRSNTTKPRKSRKLKEIVVVDKEISKLSKLLKVVSKIYTATGSVYKVYNNIPSKLIIDEITESGRKVMATIYPDTHDVYMIKYYKPGMQSWPFGGVKIYNKTLGETRYVYPESVVKHKDVEYYNRVIKDYV